MPAALPVEESPAPARKTNRKRHKARVPHPPTVADAPLNPTAWWNTLQDQFTKIAATASSTAAPPPRKPGKTAGRRSSTKSAKTG